MKQSDPMNNLIETYEFLKESIENNEHNEVIIKLRELLALDRSWSSFYKIDNSSDNIGITFTKNDTEVIINILATPGNGVSFIITFNGDEVAKQLKDDDVENILHIIDCDDDFKSALSQLKAKMDSVSSDSIDADKIEKVHKPKSAASDDQRKKILDLLKPREEK